MVDTVFKRIDTVFLPASNLERSIEWYTTTLGLPLLWKNEGVACFKLGETPLTLLQYRFPGFVEPPSDDFQFQPVREVPFNFYAADIEQARATLIAKGVTVGEIVDHGGVKDFLFEDPDGNLLGVCWWPE